MAAHVNATLRKLEDVLATTRDAEARNVAARSTVLMLVHLGYLGEEAIDYVRYVPHTPASTQPRLTSLLHVDADQDMSDAQREVVAREKMRRIMRVLMREEESTIKAAADVATRRLEGQAPTAEPRGPLPVVTGPMQEEDDPPPDLSGDALEIWKQELNPLAEDMLTEEQRAHLEAHAWEPDPEKRAAKLKAQLSRAKKES